MPDGDAVRESELPIRRAGAAPHRDELIVPGRRRRGRMLGARADRYETKYPQTNKVPTHRSPPPRDQTPYGTLLPQHAPAGRQLAPAMRQPDPEHARCEFAGPQVLRAPARAVPREIAHSNPASVEIEELEPAGGRTREFEA